MEITKLEELWKENPEITFEEMLQMSDTNNNVGKDNLKNDTEDNILPVELSYDDGYHYKNVLTPLIKLEADYDKELKESQSRDNISLRWELSLNLKHIGLLN